MRLLLEKAGIIESGDKLFNYDKPLLSEHTSNKNFSHQSVFGSKSALRVNLTLLLVHPNSFAFSASPKGRGKLVYQARCFVRLTKSFPGACHLSEP